MRRLLVGCLALSIALGTGGAHAAEDGPLAAGSFGPTGSLADLRAWHSATLLPDGRVFVIGGEGVHDVVFDDDGNAETIGLLHHTAEVWDPATGTFSAAGSSGSCHGWGPAMLLPDGRVLIYGRCFAQVSASAEFWNPGTGSFGPATARGDMPLHGPRTLLPDGRILFVGGLGYEEEPRVAGAVIWDPGTTSSTPAGSLEIPRQGHTATLLPDGRVLVAGGLAFGSDTASAELWDPHSGTFSAAGRLGSGPRIHHTATLLDDGRVLIVGGSGRDGDLASAELWDPETASFGPAGSLTETRAGQDAAHTATLLPDGRVLVVGGYGSDGVLASAELWDQETASFGPAGSMAQARGHHTATLLPDGRVLVVGGKGIDDDFYASAELWQAGGG